MNDNPKHSEKYLTFSQRQGYESMPEPMRLEEISDALRREIWNETRRLLESFVILDHYFSKVYFNPNGVEFVKRVIGKLLKISEDEVDTKYPYVINLSRKTIRNYNFNEVLDLAEIISNEKPEHEFARKIAHAFEAHAAAYWLDLSRRPYRFFPRSTKMQDEATRSAIATIRNEGMKGAETHLRQAADHINARQFADSITDSIHAVESVARTIDPKAKTLGPALDSLQKSGLLKHPALKEAFSKLYGYTSDEQGIRHALLDKGSPDVDLDEAMFMFGACASFAAYLVNKHRKAAQTQGSGQ